MMGIYNNLKEVAYSYEHGDQKLLPLFQLVSDTPDPMKEKILTYLKTNCIAACPGRICDEITPGGIIGSGNLYSDGTFLWDDCFTNYVRLYNIPVPYEFRDHILSKYSRRMKRHALFRTVDHVEISNNPYLGYQYDLLIKKNGTIVYNNNTDNKEGGRIEINIKDANYIITPIMTGIFCYDKEDHGRTVIDGYHWRIRFYSKGNMIDEKEGWPGEDASRYREFLNIVSFAERFIPCDLGSRYMNRCASES